MARWAFGICNSYWPQIPDLVNASRSHYARPLAEEKLDLAGAGNQPHRRARDHVLSGHLPHDVEYRVGTRPPDFVEAHRFFGPDLRISQAPISAQGLKPGIGSNLISRFQCTMPSSSIWLVLTTCFLAKAFYAFSCNQGNHYQGCYRVRPPPMQQPICCKPKQQDCR